MSGRLHENGRLDVEGELTETFDGRVLEDLNDLWNLENTIANDDCETNTLRDGEFNALNVRKIELLEFLEAILTDETLKEWR